jgi:hypothetical protein
VAGFAAGFEAVPDAGFVVWAIARPEVASIPATINAVSV